MRNEDNGFIRLPRFFQIAHYHAVYYEEKRLLKLPLGFSDNHWNKIEDMFHVIPNSINLKKQTN